MYTKQGIWILAACVLGRMIFYIQVKQCPQNDTIPRNVRICLLAIHVGRFWIVWTWNVVHMHITNTKFVSWQRNENNSIHGRLSKLVAMNCYPLVYMLVDLGSIFWFHLLASEFGEHVINMKKILKKEIHGKISIFQPSKMVALRFLLLQIRKRYFNSYPTVKREIGE